MNKDINVTIDQDTKERIIKTAKGIGSIAASGTLILLSPAILLTQAIEAGVKGKHRTVTFTFGPAEKNED